MAEISYDRFQVGVREIGVQLPPMRHGSLEYGRSGALFRRPKGAQLGFCSRALGDFKSNGEEVNALGLWVDHGDKSADMEFELHSVGGDRLLNGYILVFSGRSHNPAGVEVSFRGRKCVVGDNGMLVMLDAASQVTTGDHERTLDFVLSTQRTIQGMIEGRVPGEIYVQHSDIPVRLPWGRGHIPLPSMVPLNRAA